MQVREAFTPHAMGVNASRNVPGTYMGGFLCVTAGTVTITDFDGTVLVNAFPLTAGVMSPIPINFSSGSGGVVALAGGASGTLLV
jgi:hypothetical protein